MSKVNIASLASGKVYRRVIYAIEDGADINAVTKLGYSALHFAVKNSTFENVKYLVEKGINVNIKNNLGDTPLIGACACNRDNIETIKFLITEGGANVNEKNNKGETPLIMACRNYRHDIVKFLITEGGADVIEPIDATYNIDIMKLLVEHGAKVNPNALSQIVNSWYYRKDFERIKFLVEHGANVNSEGNDEKTILYIYMIELFESKYIYNKDIEKYTNIVKYLISKGVDTDLLSWRKEYYIKNPFMFPEITTFVDDDLEKECMKIYEEVMIEKCKERSSLLKEELIAKFMSPENIEKWGLALNKPFDEVIEVM